jgi:hypothetical protein
MGIVVIGTAVADVPVAGGSIVGADGGAVWTWVTINWPGGRTMAGAVTIGPAGRGVGIGRTAAAAGVIVGTGAAIGGPAVTTGLNGVAATGGGIGGSAGGAVSG